MARIAVYGGSFEPPHMGHYFAIKYLQACAPVDEIWVEPAGDKHPFGKRLSPLRYRRSLIQAMINHPQGLQNPTKPVLACAHESRVGSTGYSLDLMRYLMVRYPEHEFRIVYGSDLLHVRHKFHNWDELCEVSKPIFMRRSGYNVDPHAVPPNALVLPLEMPEVSSTAIRALLSCEKSVDGLIHPAVVERMDPIWSAL